VTLQRIVLAIVALVAVAWMAVSYADSRVIADVQAVSGAPSPTPAQLEGALHHARDAGTLDPSRGVEILSYEASLQIRLNKIPDALRSLEEIVRLEPDYAEAWFLIAKFTPDRARAAEAAAQVRRLNPPVRRKKR
jgi:tetratricopeptide (TPR) repeat protein